jgi:hypothetical protein
MFTSAAPGFHDREHVAPKPENTIRVAVRGNSCTEAMQIPWKRRLVLDDSFSKPSTIPRSSILLQLTPCGLLLFMIVDEQDAQFIYFQF